MKKFLYCLLMFVMLSSCSKVYTSRFITGDQFKDAIVSEVNISLSEIVSQLNSRPKAESHLKEYFIGAGVATAIAAGIYFFVIRPKWNYAEEDGVMKRLFILFLVVIMLAGCGRRSIVKHDIEGQYVYIMQQTEEETNSVVDFVERDIERQDLHIIQQIEDVREAMLVADDATIIYGIGMIAGGVAVIWANATWFGGSHKIERVGSASIQAGVWALLGLAREKALEWEKQKETTEECFLVF
jgi:uncharacterized protein YceK